MSTAYDGTTYCVACGKKLEYSDKHYISHKCSKNSERQRAVIKRTNYREDRPKTMHERLEFAAELMGE